MHKHSLECFFVSFSGNQSRFSVFFDVEFYNNYGMTMVMKERNSRNWHGMK